MGGFRSPRSSGRPFNRPTTAVILLFLNFFPPPELCSPAMITSHNREGVHTRGRLVSHKPRVPAGIDQPPTLSRNTPTTQRGVIDGVQTALPPPSAPGHQSVLS